MTRKITMKHLQDLADTYALIGKRVQVPVWSDTWMMGDRYGVIASLTHTRLRHKEPGDGLKDALIARVKLDKSGRTKPWRVSDLEIID